MIRICTLLIGLAISIPAFTQAQWTWAHQMGGWNNTFSGTFLGIDNSGGLYMAGDFSGTRSFGGSSLTASGTFDAFVGKIDTAGNFVWLEKAGGTGASVSVFASYTSPNGSTYMTGKFSGTVSFGTYTLTATSAYDDMFIACYDNQGTVTWAQSYGGSGYAEGRAIFADNSGIVYITGAFSGSISFGSNNLVAQHQFNTDIFVLKLSGSGNILWAKRAGSATQEDKGNGITVDGSGNVFVTGTYKQTADFDTDTLVSSGEYDMFLVKYDPTGNVSWTKKAGGSGFGRAAGGNALALDQNGNIYVTGIFNGTNISFGNGYTLNETQQNNTFYGDFFLAKYNASSGNTLWAKKGGGSSVTDSGNAIDIDSQGNIYVTGSFQNGGSPPSASFDGFTLVSAGLGDVFVIRYSPNGDVSWVVKLGAGNEDAGRSIIANAPNKVFVSGYFTGNVTVASTTLSSPANTWQIFFARVDAGTTAINEISSFSFKMFPNPTSDILYLDGKGLETIEITDQLGKIIYTSELTSGKNTVDVSSLDKGIYFIKIGDGKSTDISKLIIN